MWRRETLREPRQRLQNETTLPITVNSGIVMGIYAGTGAFFVADIVGHRWITLLAQWAVLVVLWFATFFVESRLRRRFQPTTARRAL